MPRDPQHRRDPQLSPRPAREVLIPDAVCWHDGMPLAPQHFQESFRRFERVLDHHLQVLAPHHYGVISLQLDRASLAGRVLSVTVEAVLPDHLVVRTTRPLTLRLDAAALRKSAADLGGRADLFDVYLYVPNEHPGRAAAGESPRYRMDKDGARVADDTTGQNDLEVTRLAPRVQLAVDLLPPPDSSWIRLAQLRLEGDAFSPAEYIAPQLVVADGTPLFSIAKRVVESIRSLANRLGEKINVLSMNTDAPLIAETRRQLYHLTAALPPFEAALYTGSSHPYPLYLALTAILGQLAPLARSPVLERLPDYQHDDLEGVFTALEARIQRIIVEGIKQSFKAHPFSVDEGVFRLDFVSDWSDRSVVLALRDRQSGDVNRVKKWMAGAIVGPLRRARDLQASRALGVDRTPTKRKDDLVPTSDEALFELNPSDLKGYFRADEPIVVWNPAVDSAETRPVEVVLYVQERTDWS